MASQPLRAAAASSVWSSRRSCLRRMHVRVLHLGSLQGFADNQADALAYVGTLLGGGWWRARDRRDRAALHALDALDDDPLSLALGVRDGARRRLAARSRHARRRDEPLWSLAIVTVLVTLCELVTGFSQERRRRSCTLVAQRKLDFSGPALRALGRRGGPALRARSRLRGSAASSCRSSGALALLGVLVATVSVEDRILAWYAFGGVLLGIPFALWRGRTLRG